MAGCVVTLPASESTAAQDTVTVPSGPGLFTSVPINNLTWTPLPATPLAGRVAIAVQNRTGQLVKFNFNQPAGFVGMEVDDNEERNYDLTDGLILYAKSEDSAVNLGVEEIAD